MGAIERGGGQRFELYLRHNNVKVPQANRLKS